MVQVTGVHAHFRGRVNIKPSSGISVLQNLVVLEISVQLVKCTGTMFAICQILLFAVW